MCFLFHKWSKWEDIRRIKDVKAFYNVYKYEYFNICESWQTRKCLKCGKKEWQFNALTWLERSKEIGVEF